MGNAYYKRDTANRNNYQRWLKENATVKANKIAVALTTLETLSSIKGPALLVGPKREVKIMDQHIDHFPDLVNKKREDLVLGHLTDDQMANAVFLYGNSRPDFQDVIDGKAKMPIVYLDAAKERIRWLSRQLNSLQLELDKQRRELESLRPSLGMTSNGVFMVCPPEELNNQETVMVIDPMTLRPKGTK